MVVPDQAAHVGFAGNTARGVGGDNLAAVVPRQPAHVVVTRHAGRGVAAANPAIDHVDAHQPADILDSRYAARHVAGADLAHVVPGQPRGQHGTRHVGVDQPDVPDLRRGIAEQAGKNDRVRVDEEIADRPPVALEDRTERILQQQPPSNCLDAGAADRRPAFAAVPVIVARIRTAAPVGVEVQVRRQLVADASAGAPHVDRPLGKGSGRVVGPPDRCVIQHAVAVQVVAHRIELGQVADIDEVIVIEVVVPDSSRDHDREARHHAQAAGICRAHRNHGRARPPRGQPQLRPRPCDRHPIGVVRQCRVGQRVVFRIGKRVRHVGRHGSGAPYQRPVWQHAIHHHRRPVAVRHGDIHRIYRAGRHHDAGAGILIDPGCFDIERRSGHRRAKIRQRHVVGTARRLQHQRRDGCRVRRRRRAAAEPQKAGRRGRHTGCGGQVRFLQHPPASR